MKNKLYSFDKLAYNPNRFGEDWNPYKAIATAEEKTYIKSLRPDKLIEYLAVRNEEEFINRI